ncbi:TPA: hypothetical protein DDX46_02700 [Candidatus Saccharibacteria bacterium]|nr:MAG: hypothetical protein UW38_C0001G0360 [Candidatus Saccharibacteria bacterium GW2011_GWC2_44_17]HBH77635.1 hypothetical protein [Candidatus Saccharibacteria bacterium]
MLTVFYYEKMNTDATSDPVRAQLGSQPQGAGLSVAGFSVSIVALLTNAFLIGIPAIVGFILSLIGRIQTKRSGAPSGLALAGIIISSVSAVLTLFVYGFVLIAMVINSDCSQPTSWNIQSCIEQSVQEDDGEWAPVVPDRSSPSAPSQRENQTAAPQQV